jgi:hypothetical protein
MFLPFIPIENVRQKCNLLFIRKLTRKKAKKDYHLLRSTLVKFGLEHFNRIC